jgi:type VI secretion system protein ImpA
MPVNAELLAALLAPIPGDNPSGKDLRYDPRYDKIKDARREDLDLPAGGLATERKVADWPAVVTQARALLEKETKDLQLAAWLAEALLKRESFGGFATGLQVTAGLLEQYWDTLWPELDPDDLELRAGPLEWMGARLDVAVRQAPVASAGVSLLDYQLSRAIPYEQETAESGEKREAREEASNSGRRMPEEVDKAIASANKTFYKTLVADVRAAQDALAALERAADEKFGRDAPAFGRLRGALEDVHRTGSALLAQKLEADPDPVADSTSPDAVGAYAPPGEGGGAAGPLAPEPTSAADAGARVAGAARFLRAADPANPAPYLMLRGLRWGELRATPGEVDPRLLEAPPTAARAKLKALLLDGSWNELLEQGEHLMATPQGRGWLDLQRYTLTACAQLGGEYEAVRTAVRSELRTLLAALPRLPQMTLMDDTPTANAETQEWLSAEGLAANGGRASARDAADAADDVEPDDGSGVLDDALAQDDETAENGGLARPATRHRRAVGSARDPFTLARSELAAGRPNKAIEMLVAELSRERSPRGRFVRETQLAFVMVEAGMHAVARPILEQLVKVIEERQLEAWEAGPLVAQPLALLCRCLDSAGDDYTMRNDLYLRVCRLDPLQAIALQPRG